MSSRAWSSAFVNDTGRTIMVFAGVGGFTSCGNIISGVVDGLTFPTNGTYTSNVNEWATITFAVPPGSTYTIYSSSCASGNPIIYELR